MPVFFVQVISGHYRRHSLALTFDLAIFPEEEHFSYSTNVMFDQKEPGATYFPLYFSQTVVPTLVMATLCIH